MGARKMDWFQISISMQINGYGKAERIDDAESLFNELVHQKSELNSIGYNSMISVFCRTKNMVKPFQFCDEMRSKGIFPTSLTYSCRIDGLSNIGRIQEAEDLLNAIREVGLMPNVFCYTSLMGGHCKRGEMDKAESIFQEMCSNGVSPNKITYTIMISGICKIGDLGKAAKLLEKMAEDGISPGSVTYSVL